ncbi:Glucose dehydrogenase like protein [Argiope bruennichi]|uniref:Glucose dehydrogenase like protein n=1 Tax=Argiope bruennichi TaxID=94029 RepID=A0A8T0F1Q5_ARGBR|nr:Glucose dehydrogenase like protein [Argiope bruennichi]
MYNLTVEASYPTPYASSSFLPLILLSMIGQKHTPDTTTEIKDVYDYVIVGGGSAGSVVASRLAEKHCVTVLLLEAGKPPPKVTDIPTAARSFIQSDIDWNYSTAPQEHTGAGLINRSVAWPSGKLLVAQVYAEVLRYFKKLETNTNQDFVNNGYHGVNGPITASNPEYDSELKAAVFDYARNKGIRIGDINGPQATGLYDMQASTRNGQRCSAAKAYLVPSENKTNLDIVAGAFVKKIIIENRMAKGVVFDFEGATREVRAYKEIILSAGTTNTAQLLMLSGIGPRAELEKHKIPVIADLPVGKNLQDHWATILSFELAGNIKPFAEKQVDESQIKNYIDNKKGVLTSPQGVNLLAFLNRNEPIATGNYPDHQLYFWEGATDPPEHQLRIKPEYFEAIFGPYKEKPFYFCLSQILHPKGRGEVTLRSADAYDPPVIDPKYFSDPDDLDVVVEGMKKCKEIGESEELKKIGSKIFTTVYPGCEDSVNDDDSYFRCIARSIVITLNHQVGTAKMGNPRDPATVVDPKLRVKTIRHLRVVDASVMPHIPGGNTNIPTMMVAEKGSDIIKEDIRCEGDNDLHSFFTE